MFSYKSSICVFGHKSVLREASWVLVEERMGPLVKGSAFFQGAASGGWQKEFDHFFLCFGTFLATFSDACVAFFVTFCFAKTTLAAVLLQQGDSWQG